MIVATAGHVDHGKTTLIRLLTGIDTDRLPEEKQRGMSIDIGFAHADLGNGQPAGFVDVPGHERFARNMLAGVAAVDFALLVVAADDGVMPQTVEHLAVLDLLGIATGAVALTKTDRVDAARIAAVATDIAALLAQTGLRDAPVFPVSAIDGAGMAALRTHLARSQQALAERAQNGNFRLAVDRSFTLPGAGLVVTGAVLSGRVAVGDSLMLSPAGLSARVRAIRVHDDAVLQAGAGMRCALNLAGDIRREDVGRGDWLLAAAVHAPAQRIDVRVQAWRQADAPLLHWTPVQLHLGAAEQSGHVALLQGKAVAPGEAAHAQLVLDRPLPAFYGDRFILRSQSAQRVIGGGMVIAPAEGRQRLSRAARLARVQAQDAPDATQALSALLRAEPMGIALRDFVQARNLTSEETAQLLSGMQIALFQQGDATLALDGGYWQALLARLPQTLAEWHALHPDAIGPSDAVLMQHLRGEARPEALQAAIRWALEQGVLVRDRRLLRLPGHSPQLLAADRELLARIEPLLRAGGLRPPIVGELAAALGMERDALLAFCERISRLGYLEPVAPNRYFLSETVAALAATADELARASENGEFDAAQYRNRTGIGRNLTIEVLEYLDRVGITRYAGGRRRMAG